MHRHTASPITWMPMMGRNGRRAHRLHRERHDAGDQDDAGEPDHEGTPPVGASMQRCGHLDGRPCVDVGVRAHVNDVAARETEQGVRLVE
jgi:hypothetical protein